MSTPHCVYSIEITLTLTKLLSTTAATATATGHHRHYTMPYIVHIHKLNPPKSFLHTQTHTHTRIPYAPHEQSTALQSTTWNYPHDTTHMRRILCWFLFCCAHLPSDSSNSNSASFSRTSSDRLATSTTRSDMLVAVLCVFRVVGFSPLRVDDVCLRVDVFVNI